MGKKEVKLSSFDGGMTLYVENPKHFMKKKEKPVRTNKSSKVAKYKINTQKSAVFV